MACPDLGSVNWERASVSERVSIRSDGPNQPGKRTPPHSGRRRGPLLVSSLSASPWLIAFVTFLVLLQGACSSSRSRLATPASIEFTSVPVAGADSSEKMGVIAGRVIGAQPGQQIVIYARGETTWWVQPFANQPFTRIQPNSRWSNLSHPGTEYAALLVGPDFHPAATTASLPTLGVLASATVKGQPPFWRTWWFPLLSIALAGAVIVGVHRLRLHQISRKLNERFEERLAERTRVAQELHDTLLQGVLSAAMQLDVAIDQLPADSPVLPAMNRVLQLMRQVVDEGRNTLRGLRSSGDSAQGLAASLLRIPKELGGGQGINFRGVVEGLALPLRPAIRDDVYRIGREALVNALRHSGASNIDVHLEYSAGYLRIIVRDDGRGIDPQVLRSGRDGHWGLPGMRERAEKIGARVKVFSRPGAGTEVELSVPGEVAFDSFSSNSYLSWFTNLRRREKQAPAERERERQAG